MLNFIFQLRQFLNDNLALLAFLLVDDVGYGAVKIVDCAGLLPSLINQCENFQNSQRREKTYDDDRPPLASGDVAEARGIRGEVLRCEDEGRRG